MSIDVLNYNEITKTNNVLRETCIPAANTAWYNCGLANGQSAGFVTSMTSTAKQQYFPIRLGCGLYVTPWCCDLWSKVPTLDNVTSGFLVCDPSGNFRCGSSCSWTVPAGATYARFQLWGAGAGSHNMCCCGGGVWAGSGAYASVIIPVVPGCTYTICSGCARCCYNQEAGPTAGAGCASYVTGYGLCNFCAEGGEPNPFVWIQRATNCSPNMASVCVIQNVMMARATASKGTYYGFCMCTGGGFCYSGTTTAGSTIPYTTSCKIYYGTVTNPSNRCHFVIGTPGQFASACTYQWSGAWIMCQIHPPMFGCNVTCAWSVNPGQTCAGCNTVPASSFPIFGRGGMPTSVGGGCANCGGGIGAMGAVCVQYTTTT